MPDSDPAVGVAGAVTTREVLWKSAQGWEDAIPLIDRVVNTETSLLLGLPPVATMIPGGCNDRLRLTLLQKRALLNLLCLQWSPLKARNSPEITQITSTH